MRGRGISDAESLVRAALQHLEPVEPQAADRERDSTAVEAPVTAALATHPDEPQLLAALAAAYVRQKAWRQASDAAGRALACGLEDDPAVLVLMGVSLAAQDRASAGIPYLSQAYAIAPDFEGLRRTIFWTRVQRWQSLVRLGALVPGLWAVIDPSWVGLLMLLIAVAVFGFFAYRLLKSGRWLWGVKDVLVAVALTLGHFLFAPHAFNY